MAFQFRQGTEAERVSSGIIPASGELIYCTDSRRWYGGDGITPGGVATSRCLGQHPVPMPTASEPLAFDAEARIWRPRSLGLRDFGDMPAGEPTAGTIPKWNATAGRYEDGLIEGPFGSQLLILGSSSVPPDLLAYLSCDGPNEVAPVLENEGSGGGSAAWAFNEGESDNTDLSREDAPAPFGGALRTTKEAGTGAGGFVRVSLDEVLPLEPWTMKMRFNITFDALDTHYGWLIATSGYHGPYFSNWEDSSTGYLRFWLNDEYGGSSLTDDMPFPIGAWTEYCATHDGTTLREFIDGQLLNSVEVPLFPLHMVGVDSSTEFHLGGTWDAFNGAFAFDEFQFWSGCLHTSNYTPAASPLSLAATLPETGRVGQLWSASPQSEGLYVCTAPGPPATWQRIAFLSDLPAP